jgi:hypothetical protein
VANDSPRDPLPFVHTLLVGSPKDKLLLAFNFALVGSKLATFKKDKMSLKAYFPAFEEVSH